MKTVFVRGSGKVTFSQNDFIAKGGEGEVYGQGNTIYKIYLDRGRMIPEAKIRELQQINHKDILKPKQILLDDSNNQIGFTMDWVKDSLPLCKLFNNNFRDKNNIKPKTIVELVDIMREMIFKIHDSKCLMVDGNEFNYLVNDSFTKPYFIDVDSYQTQNSKQLQLCHPSKIII